MKRTTRRLLFLVTLNALVVAALVGLVVALKLNWDTIGPNFWNPEKGDNWHDLITTGAVNTIKYTAISFFGGLVLAVALALGLGLRLEAAIDPASDPRGDSLVAYQGNDAIAYERIATALY